MADAPWRITVYDAALGPPLRLPAGPPRFVYVHDGAAMLDTPLPAGEGRFVTTAATLSGQGLAWIFEAGPQTEFLAGPGVSLVLSRAIPTPQGPRLLRADHIQSPPGSITPRHGHRGPGIRRLLKGRILGEIGDGFERIDPGQAWFETGADPVIGANIHDGPSAFVRVMVLPPELAGGHTSFVAWDAAEAAKPRAVHNRIFQEVTLCSGTAP